MQDVLVILEGVSGGIPEEILGGIPKEIPEGIPEANRSHFSLEYQSNSQEKLQKRSQMEVRLKHR